MARHTKQEFSQQVSSPGAPLLTPVSAQGMLGRNRAEGIPGKGPRQTPFAMS